jgi:GNAT superfamily N-acetyltransferase
MSAATISVRAAMRDDVPRLVEFNLAMARETESKELDPERVSAGVAGVFDRDGRGRYWIAEEAGSTVGALMVTYEWSDWRNGDFWWIQSVYVVPARRRHGVFKSLYATVLAEARATAGVAGLRLYVDEENRDAQRVYAAVGMARSHYGLFELDFVLGG